jgi:hypothetical protein
VTQARINVTQASPLQKSGLCIPQRTLACVTCIRAHVGLWRCENPDCQKGRLLPRRSGEPPGQPRRRAVDRLPLLLSSKIGSKRTSANAAVAVRWIGDRPYCPKCHAQFQRCCLAPSLRMYTCTHIYTYIYMYTHIYIYICMFIYTCKYTHTHAHIYTLSCMYHARYIYILSLAHSLLYTYIHSLLYESV